MPPGRAGGRRSLLLAGLAGVATLSLLGGAVGGYVAGQQTEPQRATTGVARAGVSLSEGTLDVAAVVAAVEPSVVSVETSTSRQNGPFGSQGSGAGTGVVLTAGGEVLTNAHVVSGATTIEITVPGDATPRAADVVAVDTGADLALLRLTDTDGLVPAPLGSSASLAVGDDVVAIGNALALEGGPSVTRGIVSALDRSIDTSSGSLSGLVQTDAAISSGNSGGPLVNAAGQVVGINTAVATSSGSVAASNIGFAISIDEATTVVERLRRQG